MACGNPRKLTNNIKQVRSIRKQQQDSRTIFKQIAETFLFTTPIATNPSTLFVRKGLDYLQKMIS